MSSTIKQRIYKFDNVKFLAILLVVIGHCIEGYVDNAESEMFTSLYIFIYSFHMPLFIFLSGLFFKRLDKDSKFNINRFTFFIIMGFLLKLYRGLVNHFTGSSANLKLMGTSSIEWFMFVMAFYVLTVYLIRRISPKIVIPISIVLGCLIGLVEFSQIQPIFHKQADFLYLGRYFVFMPFFMIGYYLTPEKVLNFCNKLYIRIPSILALVGYFILCFRQSSFVYSFRRLFTGRNPYSAVKMDNCFIQHRLLCYLVSAILVIGVISLIPNKRIPIITHMGENSLSTYFWHNPIIKIAKYFGLFTLFESFGDPLWKILVFAFAIALTLLFSLDIFNWPFKKLRSICNDLHPEICYMLNIIIAISCLFVFYFV